MKKNNVKDVRREFSRLLAEREFMNVHREAAMTDLMGSRTLEIIGASFVADEEVIFGEVNKEYLQREKEWYALQSRNVNDIPGGAPAVWKSIASPDGTINSNYGWCVWSSENGNQFDHAVEELKNHPHSRRATMIYTRPSMWIDYNLDGRSDFMCTNTVQYLIRDNKLHAYVQLRSNDAIFGFKNDLGWQRFLLEKMVEELHVPAGDIIWNVGSLHIYSRHFYLVDNFVKTGDLSIPKKRYKEIYSKSEFSTL